jgi:hypothetical protein
VKLLNKEVDLEFLSSQYENIQFHMFGSNDRISFISCLVCVCNSSKDIVDNWQAIQNMATVYYQNSGGFNSWNMYLVFFSVEKIPIWEKYKIENNKFSARKIVLDELQESPSLEQLTSQLENQLLGSDLTLDNRSFPAEKNSTYLEKYYHGTPIDLKSESREKRARVINNIIDELRRNEN